MKQLKRLLCRHYNQMIMNKERFKSGSEFMTCSYKYDVKVTIKCMDCGKIITKRVKE